MNALSVIVITASALGVIWIARLMFIQERNERLRRELQAAAFRNRPKCPILEIGRLTSVPGGKFRVEGFEVALIPGVPPFCAMSDGERVRDLWAGWTDEELVEFVTRRKEFEL